MIEVDKVTGQKINYKEGNDNAPPSYSSPSELFKATLRFYAHLNCSKCGWTGYIGSFKNVVGGRCFKCIPDVFWDGLLGELIGIGTDDETGKELCEIRKITSDFYTLSGYIVIRAGRPPIESTPIFPTVEDAVDFAREIYKI